MGSSLSNLSGVEYKNLISAGDSGQSMTGIELVKLASCKGGDTYAITSIVRPVDDKVINAS
jgi:hypothetical protein